MTSAPAPLHSATVAAVLIRRDTTSVMLAIPEEHGRATGSVVRTASGTVVGGEDVQCFPFADTDESDDVE